MQLLKIVHSTEVGQLFGVLVVYNSDWLGSTSLGLC